MIWNFIDSLFAGKYSFNLITPKARRSLVAQSEYINKLFLVKLYTFVTSWQNISF